MLTAITTFATGGLTAGWAEGIAGGMNLGAAGQAAVQAGMSTLANQASIALVSNQGDLGAALEQMGSSDNLRALISAVTTAGLSSHLTAGIKPLSPQATAVQNMQNKVQTGLINASVDAALSTAILATT